MSGLKSITLTTPLTTITLPVEDAQPTDQFMLKGATGLGPPEINVSLGDRVGQDDLYLGSWPQDREIVLGVRLNPIYGAVPISASEMRALLYSTLAGQFPVRIVIHSDPGGVLPEEMYADGFVRRIEISSFSRDSEVQITMQCPTPWFKGMNDIYLNNPIGVPIAYEGTAPCGFELAFDLVNPTSDVVIKNESNTVTVESVFAQYDTMTANSTVVYSSITGERKFFLAFPSGSQVPLSSYSTFNNNIWPALRPGSNFITVTGDPDMGSPNLAVTFTSLKYRPQYWGI